jgi:hypothetical protein
MTTTATIHHDDHRAATLAAAGSVCLLAHEGRPGVLTVILEPGVAIEVVELQRLGDKCVVQLRYTAGAGEPAAAPARGDAAPALARAA